MTTGCIAHRGREVRWVLIALLTGCATWGLVWIVGRQAATDAAWEANAELRNVQLLTDTSIGAAQGITRRGDRLYVYGDLRSAKARVGVIREYPLGLVPTETRVQLSRNGKPLIRHPTGLTWDDDFGCFVGDTVDRTAMIYQIDWNQALADGHLDKAVLTEIRDDAATNGTRPEFVTYRGQRLLATADYGNNSPEIRLYDPRRLLDEKRSAAPGVVVHRFPCGPFNQSLRWDGSTGELTCIQNVIPGRGWRLDVIALERAIERRGVEAARLRTVVFDAHDELEGFCPLPDGASIFVTSSGRNNLIRGSIQLVPRFASSAGSRRFAP